MPKDTRDRSELILGRTMVYLLILPLLLARTIDKRGDYQFAAWAIFFIMITAALFGNCGF